jgi:lactate dehydrogenase-like 2-hydroxyacid dehydrogenase
LLKLDNVVLTPHVASSTEETMGAMGECVVANLVSWFEGCGALTPVA